MNKPLKLICLPLQSSTGKPGHLCGSMAIQTNGRKTIPVKKLILADIRQGNCYVYRERGVIVGAFSFFLKPDPTYAHIYHGKWRNDAPYGVVHRLAVAVHGKGIAGACLEYAFSQCRNLRIDTHRDNLPMQRLLEKQGFHFCGIIFLESGAERLAYQKTTE